MAIKLQNHKMLVSVIVPVYNDEKHITRCIDSIVNQSYQNIQIVIVNDGSTDSTVDILNDYVSHNKSIQIFNYKNSGTFKSRMNGVENSTGDVILFIDSDDYLETNAIEFLVGKMNETDADMVIGNHNIHKNNIITLVENQIPTNTESQSVIQYLLLSKLTGYIWGRLIKRHLLECIKLPVERPYTEDVLINFYIFCNHQVNIALLQYPVLNYTIHTSNISQSYDSKPVEGFFNEFEIVEKMLEEKNLKTTLSKELAIYKCRSWVVYCRKGGLKSKDKKYHRQFFKENYNLGKRHLSFYQRIEMYTYAKNVKLGNLISKVMQWCYQNLMLYKFF